MPANEHPTDPTIDSFVARFPRLFRGEPPAVWSDLPRGWADVVDQLFRDLDAMLDDDDAAARFKVIQIKEKFAGLRVYWQLGQEKTLVMDLHGARSVQRIDTFPAKPTTLFDRIEERVREAIELASTTCQACGKGDATAGGSGLITTLCDACRQRDDAQEGS